MAPHSDSEEDDPINKYILKPASERFGSEPGDDEAPERNEAAMKRQRRSSTPAAAAARPKSACRADGASAAAAKSGDEEKPPKKKRKKNKEQRRSSKDKDGQQQQQEESGGRQDTSEGTPSQQRSPGTDLKGADGATRSSPSSDVEGDDDGAARDDAQRRHVRAPAAAGDGANGAVVVMPTGVRVVDDADLANLEMLRLLRASKVPRCVSTSSFVC